MYADNGHHQRHRSRFFGLPGHAWLTDPTTALPAVVVTAIWQGFGFETVVFLAALQAIPRELLRRGARRRRRRAGRSSGT